MVGLADGALTRLTFEGFNIEPAWSADGRWVTYAGKGESGPFHVFRRRADGGGAAERLLAGPRQVPVVPGPDLRLGKPRLYVERPAMSMMSAGAGRVLLIEDRQLPGPPREVRVVAGGPR